MCPTRALSKNRRLEVPHGTGSWKSAKERHKSDRPQCPSRKQLKSVAQGWDSLTKECRASVSYKGALQECEARASHRVFYNVLQECCAPEGCKERKTVKNLHATMSHRSVKQWSLSRSFCIRVRCCFVFGFTSPTGRNFSD